ncbi:MAG TPA: biosynthetic-type acetolactate synthase large subunit [Terriglobia bacterium]|nr:biosynthetic-type acetolactate synthase large subunit [Terriglobia bacterium]
MLRAASGSELLIEGLQRNGVDVFFGLPGGVVLPLYDALHGASIRRVLVRHEQAAAFAADGYARATGRPGVCLATSGPGATNLVTALTSALMDSIPVVAITGQVPASLLGRDAFQEADIIGITLPSTKRSFAVRAAADLPAVIDQAFATAVAGRPGPVLVDIPKNVFMERTETAAPAGNGSERVAEGNRGAEARSAAREWRTEDVERAASLILKSRRPVLYVGGGTITADASEEVRALAELLHIPVATTLMAMGAFPSRHPLSLGMLGMHGSFATNCAVTECDLLLAVGARFDDRVTGRVKDFAAHARKIHIDIDPSEIGKNVRVDVGLVGDARETLAALTAAVRRRLASAGGAEAAGVSGAREEWLARIAAWRAEHPLGYEAHAPQLKPQHVVETLSQQAGEDAIVAVDVGQHQMWTAQFFGFSRPRTWLSSSGLGSMGYGFPAALGAQVAFPERQVIAIVGDGGFQMTLNELATVAQYELPVKIAILNNRSLGMVRQWQEIFFEKRYCDVDLSFAPDFARLAESYGIRGVSVERPTEVSGAVSEMLAHPGPCLVDFRVDPAENVYPIVPPGGALAEMMLEPVRVAAEPAPASQEEVLEDLWAV